MKYNKIQPSHSNGDIPEPRAASGGAPVAIRARRSLNRFALRPFPKADPSNRIELLPLEKPQITVTMTSNAQTTMVSSASKTCHQHNSLER